MVDAAGSAAEQFRRESSRSLECEGLSRFRELFLSPCSMCVVALWTLCLNILPRSPPSPPAANKGTVTASRQMKTVHSGVLIGCCSPRNVGCRWCHLSRALSLWRVRLCPVPPAPPISPLLLRSWLRVIPRTMPCSCPAGIVTVANARANPTVPAFTLKLQQPSHRLQTQVSAGSLCSQHSSSNNSSGRPSGVLKPRTSQTVV